MSEAQAPGAGVEPDQDLPAPVAAPVTLPIAIAQGVAEQYGLRQVIILAWDGQVSHCLTYGESLEDSDAAALGGDALKRVLGWPESLTGQQPSRVAAIQQELLETRQQLISELTRTLRLQEALQETQRDLSICRKSNLRQEV